jgi:hypothetical protein
LVDLITELQPLQLLLLGTEVVLGQGMEALAVEGDEEIAGRDILLVVELRLIPQPGAKGRIKLGKEQELQAEVRGIGQGRVEQAGQDEPAL